MVNGTFASFIIRVLLASAGDYLLVMAQATFMLCSSMQGQYCLPLVCNCHQLSLLRLNFPLHRGHRLLKFHPYLCKMFLGVANIFSQSKLCICTENLGLVFLGSEGKAP